MATLYGSNINEAYVELVRRNFAERQVRLEKIKTSEDAKAYIADVREKINRIFQLPRERTPLNPVVTGEHRYNGYSVENLYYYSRPDYPVTANFYKPAKIEGKIPAVLFVCGHSLNGKAADLYRTCCVNLAHKGIAVLAIDPVEQGERRQYTGVKLPYDGLCSNHNLMGKQLSLVGEWFGSWRVWDAIRGMDYLESRPEVDATRMGVTGNSGGGTLTTWFTAVDPRPVAAAPNCYVTSWKHNIENELPADIEQMPPHALEYGLEMGDFLLAQGPRHTLLLGEKMDFFDPRGTQETYEEVKRVNDLIGADTAILVGPTSHGYFKESRIAMYTFMTKHLLGKEDPEEVDTNLPPEPDTYAVGNDLKNIPGQRFLRDLLKDKVAAVVSARKPLGRDALEKALFQELNIPAPTIPYYRVLRPLPSPSMDAWVGDWVFWRYALETNPGHITAILMRFAKGDIFFHIDDTPRKEVTLYIPDQDTVTELDRRLVSRDEVIYGLDIRTIGQMMPSGTDQPLKRNFYAPYQADYHYASVSIMAGQSILAGKIYDILCAIRLLASKGAGKIVLEAKGLGTIPATFAAFLTDDKVELKLDGGIESFEHEATFPGTILPLSCIQPGILKLTDLPEIRNLLG